MINSYSNASRFLNRVDARDFADEEEKEDEIRQQIDHLLGEEDALQLQSEQSSDEENLDSVGRGEGSPRAAGRSGSLRRKHFTNHRQYPGCAF